MNNLSMQRLLAGIAKGNEWEAQEKIHIADLAELLKREAGDGRDNKRVRVRRFPFGSRGGRDKMAKYYAIIVEDLGRETKLHTPDEYLRTSLPPDCSIHAIVELEESEVVDLTADLRYRREV